MRVETFTGDQDACVAAIVKDFVAEYAAATVERGRFTVAVPGGSVATHAFSALAALGLNWNHIEVFWVDERAVPRDDAESNYALAQALWLQPAGVPRIRVHRMPADDENLQFGAMSYAAELDRMLGREGRLDFVLLGVGPDGHVASLFPGHAAVDDRNRSVVAVVDAPKPPPRRLTLTLPMLASASRVVVAAFGRTKADVLGDALSHADSTLPVAQVLRKAERPFLVVDDAAASRLNGAAT